MDPNSLVPTETVNRLLDTAWNWVVLGDSSWNPDKSCYELAKEYGEKGLTTDEAVENLIDWQTAKAAGVGFVTGLPGFPFSALTIPADLTTTTYIQLRMIAAIALINGHDPKQDHVKTLSFLCLLGRGALDALREASVIVGKKLAANQLGKVPGSILIKINQRVGFRLVTKAGTTGVVNLNRLVPVIGGLVSGTVNGWTTRRIGYIAHGFFRSRPGGAAALNSVESATPDSGSPIANT
jgi:hypothetical protein